MSNDLDIADLARKIEMRDRRSLARAITLVESTRPEHRLSAEALLAALPVAHNDSVRLGISGAPGVGKSTFIEAFGGHLTSLGRNVAVLAVDPSSSRTGGSILGDKTRMPQLSRDSKAFIRPTPAGGSLGGVARRTREVILLVEAAGFDFIIVETVGVGQSEYAVADMVDMFCLLLAPGGGDELQGIKRGIMELADLIVVNKADGNLIETANKAAADYRNALHLVRPKFSNWHVQVLLASAILKEGFDQIFQQVSDFQRELNHSDNKRARRRAQANRWLWDEIQEDLVNTLKSEQSLKTMISKWETKVESGKTTPSVAARGILTSFFKTIKQH